MGNMWQWFAGAAALVLAVLLHTFYVDYEIDAKSYLVSWPATVAQRNVVIDRDARSRVRAQTERHVWVPNIDRFAERTDHVNKYCDPTERYYRLSRFSRAFTDPNDRAYFRCSKTFVPTKQEQRTIVTPGVDYGAARAVSEKKLALLPIRFGMVPSLVFAGDKPSRISFVKSYWLGVIVPAALLVLSLFMFFAARRIRRNVALATPSAGDSRTPAQAAPRAADASVTREVLGVADSRDALSARKPTLADLLRADLGEDFPVSGGNGKDDSPLVIAATRDYVAVEHAVVRHVLTSVGEEYTLSKQALLDLDGRKIDELIFDVKKAGAADWEGRRRFYFDITAGFDALE